MAGLKSSEMYWVVQSYIGVDGGYLGDMSYRSHREFYPAYCNLDIDPDQFSGRTTKEKFLTILQSQDPIAQAAILRGVAQKYPAGSEHQRSSAAHENLLELARRCSEVSAVRPPSPEISSQIVEHALKDAAALLENRSPVSAVDRAHTALHGYLKEACQRHGIEVPSDTTATQAFKLLRNGHPTLRRDGPQHDGVFKLLQSMSSMVDALAPLRNRGSLAHANEDLLDRAEAVLAINAVNTIIQFLDEKLSCAQNVPSHSAEPIAWNA
jgi:hypothetical protein